MLAMCVCVTCGRLCSQYVPKRKALVLSKRINAGARNWFEAQVRHHILIHTVCHHDILTLCRCSLLTAGKAPHRVGNNACCQELGEGLEVRMWRAKTLNTHTGTLSLLI